MEGTARFTTKTQKVIDWSPQYWNTNFDFENIFHWQQLNTMDFHSRDQTKDVLVSPPGNLEMAFLGMQQIVQATNFMGTSFV